MKLLNILFALMLTSFLAHGQCPNGLAVTVSPGGVLNCINTTVSLTAAVTGGVQPYAYSWPNGVNTPQNTVFVAGSYCVVVTDAVGCTAEACGIVTEDASIPQISISGPSSIPCGGGPIPLVASTNVPNATFTWIGPGGFTSTVQNPVITTPGTYQVIVTNTSAGCTSTVIWVITGGGLDISSQPVTCFGEANGAATVNLSPASPPVSTFLWTGLGAVVGTTQTINNLAAGAYSVTVTFTDGSRCSGSTTVGSPVPWTILLPDTVAGCGQVQLVATVAGGTAPLTYLWSNGNTNPSPVLNQTGTYYLTVVDANGCLFSDSVFVEISNNGCNLISGKISRDTSQNCLAEAAEPGLANWIVKAEKSTGQAFYGLTDSTGRYQISVFEGSYQVGPLPPSTFFETCQPALVSLQFAAPGDTLAADFVVKSQVSCPDLYVQLSSALLRRCLSNNYYYVNYCNVGSETALGASIELALDPLITPLASPLLWADLGNDHYLFQLGDIAPGECGNFWVNLEISCDAVLGQTLCSEAIISATNLCPPPPSAQLLQVSHECAADSLRFFIENTGLSPATVGYVVIEDAVMLTGLGGNSTTLQPGGTMPVSLPKNGDTWRVEANVLGTTLTAWRSVEGCGTNTTGSFSTGYVNLFPQDPASGAVDVYCATVVGSYDPNDKAARPEGFGSSHFIANGTEIEYKIRFQNTGTDTAFNVAIRDTLDAGLDPATFRAGASSHAFSTELLGEGVVVFNFKNILLPDSFVNEATSHGFVEFSIKTKNVADGTVIKNDAAIFFDFNDPVITNVVFHTIGTGFVPTATWFLPAENAKLTAAPNPFSETTVIDFGEKSAGSGMVLRVFDMFSKEIRREKVGIGRFVFERRGLPTGFYFLLLERENGQSVGSGKLIIR